MPCITGTRAVIVAFLATSGHCMDKKTRFAKKPVADYSEDGALRRTFSFRVDPRINETEELSVHSINMALGKLPARSRSEPRQRLPQAAKPLLASRRPSMPHMAQPGVPTKPMVLFHSRTQSEKLRAENIEVKEEFSEELAQQRSDEFAERKMKHKEVFSKINEEGHSLKSELDAKKQEIKFFGKMLKAAEKDLKASKNKYVATKTENGGPYWSDKTIATEKQKRELQKKKDSIAQFDYALKSAESDFNMIQAEINSALSRRTEAIKSLQNLKPLSDHELRMQSLRRRLKSEVEAQIESFENQVHGKSVKSENIQKQEQPQQFSSSNSSFRM